MPVVDLLRGIIAVGVCATAVVLTLLLRQVRISVRELRALRAHFVTTDTLIATPPPGEDPNPMGETDGRHGMHAVDDQSDGPALRAALEPLLHPRPRTQAVLAVALAMAALFLGG